MFCQGGFTALTKHTPLKPVKSQNKLARSFAPAKPGLMGVEMMNNFDQLFDNPIAQVRRNHALEHATLQILARRRLIRRMAGYSTPFGFWVVGGVGIEDLQQAVNEAQQRLNNGERSLAIHPNCGTNFAASGLVAGLAAWLAMLGGGSTPRDRLERLPLVAAVVTLAIILTQPLGPALQERFTTDANLDGLRVVQIDRFARGGLVAHRVLTRKMNTSRAS